MRATITVLGLLASLLAATAAQAAPKPPDLALCPANAPGNSGEITRTRPLPVPRALRGLLRSDFGHFAIATLGGGTVCVDTSWIERTEDLVLTRDGRFLQFHWLGYETYGHVVVDRSGKGQVVDTGVRPVFSPSRGLLAAVDQTESEFGTLSGLAVWRVGPTGLIEVARIADLPRSQHWRIDRWAGERCIQLSAVPFDARIESAADLERARRDSFTARIGSRGWKVAAGTCPSA